MLKLSVSSSDEVFVRMSKQEFEGLSRADLSQTADGATVNLSWLSNLVNAAGSSSGLIQDAITKAEALAIALGVLLP